MVSKTVVSKRVALGDVPWYQKTGTRVHSDVPPVPKTGTRVHSDVPPVPETGTRVHSPKPPFCFFSINVGGCYIVTGGFPRSFSGDFSPANMRRRNRRQHPRNNPAAQTNHPKIRSAKTGSDTRG